TARAGLVDRDALLDALRHEQIAGAGLDVFHEEPIRSVDPLLQLTNVVLTPHNAGSTAEVIDRGLQQAVENIRAFLSPGARTANRAELGPRPCGARGFNR